MKAIYFSENSSNSIRNKILRGFTELSLKAFPSMTLQTSYKVLTNPFSKREYSFKGIEPDEAITLSISMGSLKTYIFRADQESNEFILLTHGWADTARSFSPLISKLINKGYNVITFDHIGHGHSFGNISHLFGFIEGLREVLKFSEEKSWTISTLISHSMGGAALLNLTHEELRDKSVILISSPYHFFEEMDRKITGIGISPKILYNLLEDASETFDIPWEILAPQKNEEKIHENFLFIHDRDDDVCAFDPIYDLAKRTNTALYSTSELGHRGSFRDERIHQRILDFIEN